VLPANNSSIKQSILKIKLMALDENANSYNHLVELGGSDFEIADGEPNIKGWDVKNQQGLKIGEVDELLFDPKSLKVRYLVVDLDDNELEFEEDKKVLIPIGVAELHGDHARVDDTTTESNNASGIYDDDFVRLDEGDNDDGNRSYDSDDDDDKVVIVPVTASQLMALPGYVKGELSPDNEQSIRSVFEGGGVPGGSAAVSLYNKDDFYSHDHFNEDKFYKSRQNRPENKLPVIEENLQVGKTQEMTGGARITSRIVERPVEANLNLKEEHVTVQRNPVDRPISSSDSNIFKEEEMEIREYAEVPVLTKEARVVEEISVNKEVEEKERTIKETLRNTEVDAERIDTRNRT